MFRPAVSKAVVAAAMLAAVVFSGGPCLGQAAARVSIDAEVNVDTATVKLGQIARIKAAAQTAERLAQISMGYSPEPGAKRTITRAQLLISIRAAGMAEGEVTLDAGETVSLVRTFRTVSGESIRQAVADALRTKYAGGAAMVEVLKIEAPPPIRVGLGTVEVVAKPMPRVASLVEPFQVPVEVRLDGKLVRTLSATAAIAVSAEVLVAKRLLDPATAILPTDVTPERVRIARSLDSYVRDPAQLKGTRVVRPLPAGEPLVLDSIVAAAVIRAGDTVRIEAVQGRTKIIALGEARSPGKIGDRISIKNKASGAVLQAVVVDEGIVKVTF